MNKTTEKTVVINNFRLGSEIKKKLEEIAEREQRTFAGQIRLALQEWVEQKSARPVRGAAAGTLRKRPAQHTTAASTPLGWLWK